MLSLLLSVILRLPEAPALFTALAQNDVAPQDDEGSQNARHVACASYFEILRRPTPPSTFCASGSI
jgi:hypothetical protein